MDLWTDLNSGAEWGLDLFNQPNGLFGDLKGVSHLKGDMDPACQPGDAVEQMASPESQGPLDFEWMESGDLGSFLDALDQGQDGSSVQDSLFDCTQEIVLKDNLSVQQPAFSNVACGVTFNQGLTPPDSPEQVTPIIKLDPEISDQLLNTQEAAPSHQTIAVSIDQLNSIPEPGPAPVVLQTPFDLLDEQFELKPELFGGSDLFGLTLGVDSGVTLELTDSNDNGGVISSYSSDDGSSILSPSESPSVSPRPSIDSLIQSSPELYKVIATPTARFSPYSKSKCDQKVKAASRAKAKAEALLSEPDSDEFVPSNLGKKERKKLQNKNAAIRYRQKKKAEVECIASEVQDLEDRNHDLKSKVDDLQREVRYMKNLMEEIYRAKGLVK